MSKYINTFELIKCLIDDKKINAEELLSNVDEDKVMKDFLKKKKKLLHPKPILITNEPIEEENWSKIPFWNKRKLQKLYGLIRKNPAKTITPLLELKKKYPNVPAIYNYIGIAYANSGEKEKWLQNILETIKKFPTYLFGKIALAEYYLKENQHKKIPDIFDNKFDLYMHFPNDTKKFHVSELRSFYMVIGAYFARNKDIVQALLCYFNLKDMPEKHLATTMLANEIILIEIEQIRKNFHKNAHRTIKRKKRTVFQDEK